ncbi:uncharacterized protein LOC135337087 [Halichondria panicea]|uniref:uncharacterized protein LOC135337087 n=1 Tax=Halichondria panicea TaxID=6063 RepID=UPI00312B7CF4
MQSRNAGNQNRIILIGCFLLLLITGVLYFLKRIEANKLHSELSSIEVETKERVEELTSKLTDYLQKMEEMTRQLGDLQSKQTNCEDAKQKIAMETRTAKKAVEECHQQQSEHVLKQGELEDELADLKTECDGANDKVKSHLVSLTQLQQSAKDSEMELDSCQAQASQCQTTLTGMQGEMVQLRARCNQQQQLQQQQQMVQQPAQQLGQHMLPNNPVVLTKPRVSVPNQASNRFPIHQQQPVIQEQVNKEKVPSYPEEEEGDIDPLLDDKEKEDQGGDGGGNDDQELGQDEVENKARDLFDNLGEAQENSKNL